MKQNKTNQKKKIIFLTPYKSAFTESKLNTTVPNFLESKQKKQKNKKQKKQKSPPTFVFLYLPKTQRKTFSILFLNVLSFRIYMINFT